MKYLLFAALACAILFSCKTECEKDHTGTIRFTNQENEAATVRLKEGWFVPHEFEIAARSSKAIVAKLNFTDENTGIYIESGYQITGSYRLESDTMVGWRDFILTPYQCEIQDIPLQD